MPRDAYYQRTDLQLSGRTVMGMDAPRGQALCHLLLPLLLVLRHRYYSFIHLGLQELCDHYMAPTLTLALTLTLTLTLPRSCATTTWRRSTPLRWNA